jgi:glutathione-specific gamma-glutamylcyclotransferase
MPRSSSETQPLGMIPLDVDDYGGPADDPLPLPPEVEACLARKTDIWVFGYGSLMWNPGFSHCAAEPALLHGWHRSFCVYSHRYRGTPERPGLVLGLDRGGACRGVVFRVHASEVGAAMSYLWEREMVGGVYDMRELRVRTGAGEVKAHAFTVRRSHSGYAGRLGVDETARLILQGLGGRGPCREYLENTVRQLERLGLIDGPLHKLETRVKELAAVEPPCAESPIS